MSDDGTEEKKHPASARKLDKLRSEEGQTARSEDLAKAIAFCGAVAFIALTLKDLGQRIEIVFEVAFRMTESAEPGLASFIIALAANQITQIVISTAAISIGLYIIVGIVDVGGVVLSAKRIALDMTRLNPVTNVKNMFNMQALWDITKGLVKISILFIFVYFIIVKNNNGIANTPLCGVSCAVTINFRLIEYIVIAICVILLIFGFIDMKISRMIFHHENKMTDTELKREQKDNSGSPELRQERHRLRQEAASGGGVRGIGNTNVIWSSPIGAVGISFVQGKTDVPILTLKAAGEKRDALLDLARSRGVAIAEEVELAEQLVKYGRVGEMVPQELFQQAAAAFVRSGHLRRN